MAEIDKRTAITGRLLKEDSTIVNQADILDDVYDSVSHSLRLINGGSNVEIVIDDADVINNEVTFAAGDSSKDIDIPIPAVIKGEGSYLVSVYNGDAANVLTVTAKQLETLNTHARYMKLAIWTVPVSDGVAQIVPGLFAGESVRITLSYSGAGARTVGIRVRKL